MNTEPAESNPGNILTLQNETMVGLDNTVVFSNLNNSMIFIKKMTTYLTIFWKISVKIPIGKLYIQYNAWHF